MKTFNRVFVGLLIGFGLMALASLESGASVVARSPKDVFVSSYTAGAILITPVSTTTVNGIVQTAPGAVYQVILSSGASSEFELLTDTTNCVGVTAGANNQSIQIGPKLFYSSTSANSVYTFDPPILFFNGLCIIDSAATGQAAITYELGRGLTGQ